MTENYDDICYQNSFLKEVIARIDFAAPITSLRTNIPQKVANAAIERFPIFEERKALAQELQVSSSEVHHKREEFSEWNYHGRDREKRLHSGIYYLTPKEVFDGKMTERIAERQKKLDTAREQRARIAESRLSA